MILDSEPQPFYGGGGVIKRSNKKILRKVVHFSPREHKLFQEKNDLSELAFNVPPTRRSYGDKTLV